MEPFQPHPLVCADQTILRCVGVQIEVVEKVGSRGLLMTPEGQPVAGGEGLPQHRDVGAPALQCRATSTGKST